MSAEAHPGWGQEGQTVEEHVTAALQRQPTSEMEQARPTPLEEKTAEAQKAAYENAHASLPAPVKQEEDFDMKDAVMETQEPQAANDAETRKPDEQQQQAQHVGNQAQNAAAAEDADTSEPKEQQQQVQQVGNAQQPEQTASKPAKYDPTQDPDSWRKDKRGMWLNPHALYMRFYRNIRRARDALKMSYDTGKAP